jgi:hypothetical protein
VGNRNRGFAQQALKPVRGTSWSRALEIAASVTSLLLFAGAITSLHQHAPVWAVILIIWFGLLGTGAFILLYVQEHRAYRRTRYAAAVDEMHNAVHHVRDGASALLLRDAAAQDVIESICRVLDSVASTFNIITGENCRASLKEVSRAQNNGESPAVVDGDDSAELRRLEVTTMARSGHSETKADRMRHFVDQNTDFESLFLNPGQRWFMSNDLTQLEHYKNSSWQGDGPRDYRSTCVWPIEKRDAFGASKHDILGFLCVDSKEAEIFDDRFDFWVGAGVADALYPLLKMLHRQSEGIKYVPSAEG